MTGISRMYHSPSSYYGKIASGKRIHSAKDDAAGLNISQKLKKQSGAMNVNGENIKMGISAANIADGALEGVHDSLHRIQELGIRASNGLMSDSDRQALQAEVSQNLQGLDQIARNTKFNESTLLDGSSNNLHIASNPDGSGMNVNMGNSALSALGLRGFNVTGDFDLGAVDKALNAVSEQRSRIGASTNGLEHSFNYSTGASIQLTGANSRLEDLDIPGAVSKMKQDQLMNDYRFMMQRNQMTQSHQVTRLFQGL